MGISVAQAVFDREGTPQYAIAASLNLNKISKLLEVNPVSASSRAFIVERSGFLVATSSKESLFKINQEGKVQRLKAIDSNNPFIRETMINANNHFGGIENVQGLEKLEINPNNLNRENSSNIGERQIIEIVPCRDANGLDWYIFIVIPQSDILYKTNDDFTSLVVLCVGIFGILIVLGIQTTRWIVQPIFQLP